MSDAVSSMITSALSYSSTLLGDLAPLFALLIGLYLFAQIVFLLVTKVLARRRRNDA
jgi:hypothetical protein